MPALTLEGAAVKTLLHGEALDFFDGDPQELAGFPHPLIGKDGLIAGAPRGGRSGNRAALLTM
jgi:hypothetical protein